MQLALAFGVRVLRKDHTQFTEYRHEVWYNTVGSKIAAFFYRHVVTGSFVVAKGRNNTQQNSWGVDFINFRIPYNAKEQYEQWAADNETEMQRLVSDLLNEGNKISVTPDFRNVCIILTVTCKDEDGVNGGLAFSSRAETWDEAIMMALYKHFVLAPKGEWPRETTSFDWG